MKRLGLVAFIGCAALALAALLSHGTTVNTSGGGVAGCTVSFGTEGLMDMVASDGYVMLSTDTSITLSVGSCTDVESVVAEMWLDADADFGDTDKDTWADAGDTGSSWQTVWTVTNPAGGTTYSTTITADQGWHLIRWYVVGTGAAPDTNMVVGGTDWHSLTGITSYMTGAGNSTLGVGDEEILDFRINRVPDPPER